MNGRNADNELCRPSILTPAPLPAYLSRMHGTLPARELDLVPVSDAGLSPTAHSAAMCVPMVIDSLAGALFLPLTAWRKLGTPE